MNDAQKYQKKKNILIILSMILLLVLVCLICYIFIYAKNHPKPNFVSPDTIEIKNMLVGNYQNTSLTSYTVLEDSTEFKVTDKDEELFLKLNYNKEIKIIKDDTEENIEVLLNDTNINSNIKLIYQDEFNSLILTEDGKLYRVLDNILVESKKLTVGQILSDIKVKDIVKLPITTTDTYILTEDSKIINIDTQKEYDGVIRELTTDNGVIYIYDDYSCSYERGKIFTDEKGNIIRFNIVFENKLIDENAVIYELDLVNKTLTTSKLGTLSLSSYSRNENNQYTINLTTNTGYYSINSNYYYTR